MPGFFTAKDEQNILKALTYLSFFQLPPGLIQPFNQKQLSAMTLTLKQRSVCSKTEGNDKVVAKTSTLLLNSVQMKFNMAGP